jgi:hypothetical protein
MTPDGRTDVDAQSTLCGFESVQSNRSKLTVAFDENSLNYEELQRELATEHHFLQTVPGLGTRVAVWKTTAGTRVVAFYGSWYLDVIEQATSRSKPYSFSQVLAIARSVYKHLTAPRPSSGSRT